jgi:hypothetical protein
VPRYFFNMVDGYSKNLVRDSEGAEFSGVGEATKEAASLARDVARHGINGLTQTWKVVVTDENGDEVLTVPLSEIRARKIRAWFDLAGHIAKFESSFGRRTFVWLAAAAVLAIIVQAAVLTVLFTEQRGNYQTASAPTEGANVAVRFVSHANVADITQFLDAYKATIVGGPRPGGFYRLHIADTTLRQKELAKIVGRMAQEKVVEFAAVEQ